VPHVLLASPIVLPTNSQKGLKQGLSERYPFANSGPLRRSHFATFPTHYLYKGRLTAWGRPTFTAREEFCVSKIVSMPDRNANFPIRVQGVRDRRYTIRYPFAADVELIDLETGRQVNGVTSDISFGGCFVCTSKPLSMNARARMKLTRKGEVLEALVVVRIMKPRVGMGIEFFDLEASNSERLVAWMDALRHSR